MLDLQKILKNPSDYNCKIHKNLKGGEGTCEVYTRKEPSSPDYKEEGNIIMMKVNGVYPSIGLHKHEDDQETYTVITGFFEINGTIVGPGKSLTCQMGESHYAKLKSESGSLMFQKKTPSTA